METAKPRTFEFSERTMRENPMRDHVIYRYRLPSRTPVNSAVLRLANPFRPSDHYFAATIRSDNGKLDLLSARSRDGSGLTTAS